MTTSLFMNGRSQAVRLPKDFRLPGRRVRIKRMGAGVLLEPLGEEAWPEGYFDKVVVRDRSFARPAQGDLPSAPDFSR